MEVWRLMANMLSSSSSSKSGPDDAAPQRWLLFFLASSPLSCHSHYLALNSSSAWGVHHLLSPFLFSVFFSFFLCCLAHDSHFSHWKICHCQQVRPRFSFRPANTLSWSWWHWLFLLPLTAHRFLKVFSKSVFDIAQIPKVIKFWLTFSLGKILLYKRRYIRK